MKILITGGCGFVGSNLALFLKKKIKNSRIFTLIISPEKVLKLIEQD